MSVVKLDTSSFTSCTTHDETITVRTVLISYIVSKYQNDTFIKATTLTYCMTVTPGVLDQVYLLQKGGMKLMCYIVSQMCRALLQIVPFKK
jgi:hypothetical protein